ncbi:MAG: ABC transporter permease [Spirochaetales bacterium]|nr:ABC transporter permease [Spirochaetales bacterium]
MEFREIFREAADSIQENRTRTFLLILGLVIGIGSVITVVGVGDGAKVVISDILKGYGANSLVIMPNWGYLQETHWEEDLEEISREDIRDIQNHVSGLKAIVPWMNESSTATRQGVVADIRIVGTMPGVVKSKDLSLSMGRNMQITDVDQLAKCTVIGSQLAETLFPGENPLGKWIRFKGGFDFQVIGVLNPGERNFMSQFNDGAVFPDMYALVPYTSIKRVKGRTELYQLQGEVLSGDRIEEVKSQIMAVFNRNHGKWKGKYEKFIIQEAGAVIKTINTAISTVTLLISLIAAISLFVAGVGVMNIMLVSVKERTREIGVRKALGAPAATILNQFVLETLLLCGLGGLIGTGLATGIILAISHYAEWPAMVNGRSALLAISMSLVTGLVFGLLPASRAADLDPVEALRYE